jgi:hypothetical protein
MDLDKTNLFTDNIIFELSDFLGLSQTRFNFDVYTNSLIVIDSHFLLKLCVFD